MPHHAAACHRGSWLALLAATTLLACGDLASVRHGTQDLVGTPDLIVDRSTLANSWFVSSDVVLAGSCTAVEYGITPGTHRVLRFSIVTPNIGDADVFVGDPLRHVDPNGDGSYDDSDGEFEYATCHDHFHYRHYAIYQLVPIAADGSLGPPITASKLGFCLRDDRPVGSTRVDSWVYRSCGTKTRHGFQGIAAGWADVYDALLPGQYFVLDDPAAPTPPGDYLVRITVNPPYVPAAGDACPVRDDAGLCHAFAERDYANDVAEVRVHIPPPASAAEDEYGPGSLATPLLRESR